MKNIIPELNAESELIDLFDEFSGEVLVRGIPNNPDSEVAMNEKIDKLQGISDVLQTALQILKVSPGDDQERAVKMFAGAMARLHNTEFASVVRTIRDSLELLDKWKGDRADLRNKAAFDWIRKGKGADYIPFI